MIPSGGQLSAAMLAAVGSWWQQAPIVLEVVRPGLTQSINAVGPPPLQRHRFGLEQNWWRPDVQIAELVRSGLTQSVALAPPPPVGPAPLAIRRGWWQPEEYPAAVRPRLTASGPPPPPLVYVPPPRAQPPGVWWHTDVVQQRSVRSSAFDVRTPDNPPPRRMAYLAEQAWTPEIVVVHLKYKQGQSVDAPPAQARRLPDAVLPAWALDWPSQGAKKSAAWDFATAVVNNPPPRNLYAQQRIAAMWAVSWEAQRAAPNAGWNVPRRDAPPPRNLYAQSRIVAEWWVDALRFYGTNTHSVQPAFVSVFGWGARGHVGGAAARDQWQRIGSEVGKAKDGKIGGESA